jgi:integrase/recombinase XerD
VSLGKQAKTLSKGQVEATMGWLTSTRYPTRNSIILLLSVYCGKRTWRV